MNQSPESGRSNHENSLGWGVSLLISVSCVAIWVVCFLLVMNLSDEQVNAALPGVSRNWLVIATSIPLFALALVFLGLAIYRYFRRPSSHCAGGRGNPVSAGARPGTRSPPGNGAGCGQWRLHHSHVSELWCPPGAEATQTETWIGRGVLGLYQSPQLQGHDVICMMAFKVSD